MMKLLIFGGTREGRELAEWAQNNKFFVILSVATDYGESVCEPGENLIIKKGRMDSEEMRAFFERECPQLIIDATHPHAALVSENIKTAAEESGNSLIRIVRPEVISCIPDEYADWEKRSVFYARSAAEAADLLKDDAAPFLLTTGSRELPQFSSLPGFADRAYARVLPDINAISACERAGLKGSHIIAMQGPFSAELNRALIESVGAEWLITKESGRNGGFPEKVEAAAESGIRLIVIKRPSDEEGLSLKEAERELLDMREAYEEAHGQPDEKDEGALKITLIGLGMGGGSQLTMEDLEALREASLIFGAKRMIRDVRKYIGDKPAIPLYRAEEILSYMDEYPEAEKICVVFSGDTGFYSGCGSFLNDIKRAGADDGKSRMHRSISVRVMPGISAFSCLCARFGLKQEDFTPASAHGKDIDVPGLLSRYGKVFLLLDEKTGTGTVCQALTEAGYGSARIYAGINLGYPDEELITGMAKDLTGRDNDALAVMAIEREESPYEG